MDPRVLVARIAVLEDAVRALQSSDAELRRQINLLQNPALAGRIYYYGFSNIKCNNQTDLSYSSSQSHELTLF